MQRRAAAVYVALFLVVGAASFSLIATATDPELSFSDPEYTLQQNDTFTVNGTEYTVQAITAQGPGGGSSSGGGGHGGGGGGASEGITRSGTLATTNDSAIHTVEWANNSNVTYQNTTWTVEIRPSEPNDTITQFTLVEKIDRQAILQNDSSVANQTTTIDGITYVVRPEPGNDSRQLIPAGEYFPDPQTRQFSVGDEVPDIDEIGDESTDVSNRTVTVRGVTNAGATLAWVAPETIEVDVEDQTNVTVGSESHYAYFQDNSTLVLTQDFQTVAEFNQDTEMQSTMINGLWGVTILSGMTAFFMLGLAYLPSRY